MGTIDRFISKINIDENDCWVWESATNNCGYSQFHITGGHTLGHRFSYEYFIGEIPDNYEIDHLCRNRRCVNPAHLEIVSHEENCVRGTAGELGRIRNLAKTHCPHGHPYSGNNLYIAANGSRKCRTCRRLANKRYKSKIFDTDKEVK